MGKKVVISLILIVLLSSGIIFIYKDKIKELFKKENTDTVETADIIINVLSNGQRIDAEYLAGYYNWDNKTGVYGPIIEVARGKLNKSLPPEVIQFPIDKTAFIYYSAPGHYNTSKTVIPFLSKKVPLTTELVPFGKVSMNNISGFEEKEGILKINITTDGRILSPMICLSRTYGIYSAGMNEETSFCETNWTKYEGINLPSEMWGCGDPSSGKTDICTRTDGQVCHKSWTKIPERLKLKVDGCFLQSLVLNNNENIINVNYKKKDNIICDDGIGVWIIDSDREVGIEPRKDIFETPNGEQIGGDDIEKTFKVC
ncbi:MAG: hypothetical protein Q8P20_08740 [bacterium]|nr:hypothetical protein [bacterium]